MHRAPEDLYNLLLVQFQDEGMICQCGYVAASSGAKQGSYVWWIEISNKIMRMEIFNKAVHENFQQGYNYMHWWMEISNKALGGWKFPTIKHWVDGNFQQG